MSEENLPAPTRSDEQLVPVKARLPYGESNLLLDLQELQKNPIFCISVDILQNINFFKQFAASTNVPSIYIHQLWNTLIQAVTDLANPFVSSPAGEIVMDFMNELGYPECLTGKTFGNDKPRHHVLQMLQGIVTRTNVDYVELLRPESPRHVTGDDFLLGNLKFIPKGEKDDKPKVTQEKPSVPSPAKQSKRGKVRKVRKGKCPLKLIDEEAHDQALIGGVAFCEPAASGMTQNLPVVEGKEKGIAIDEHAAQSLLELQTPKKKSTIDQYIFQRWIPATLDSPSLEDAKTGAAVELSVNEADTEPLSVGKDLPQGEEVPKTVTLEERTVDVDEGPL
ncbi:hypothetical protein Tco_0471480 [Tanacetum coccineum]